MSKQIKLVIFFFSIFLCIVFSACHPNGPEDFLDYVPENPDPDKLTPGPDEEKPLIPKEYWGNWIRMDNGQTYVINDFIVKCGYNIVSEGLGTIKKESPYILRLDDKYLLFKDGGAKVDFSLKLAGFLGDKSSRAATVSSMIARKNTDNKFDKQKVSPTNDGIFLFTASVPGSTQEIYIPHEDDANTSSDQEEDKNVKTLFTLKPTYDGEQMGTIPLVESGYSFKTTYSIGNYDDGYLYGNNYNSYKLLININNIGDSDCEPSEYKIHCDDLELVFLSGVTNGNFGTIEPGKDKKLEFDVKYGTFSDSVYKDVIINIDITDSSLNSRTWNDFAILRFYQKPVSLYVNTKRFDETDSGGNLWLNGFIIHPTGKSQFFTVRDGETKEFHFPYHTSFYRLVFSGADATKEMKYSFSTSSELPDLSGVWTASEMNLFEPNDSQADAELIEDITNPSKGFLKKDDIDYYKFKVY